MTRRLSLLRCRRGATAAEFALVLPLLLLFLFGIIEAGRLMWTWNKVEKATQMAVRYATVTNPVPTGLTNYSFVGTGGLTQGDTIPETAYGTMECTKTGTAAAVCACTAGTCPWGTAASNDNFMNIYNYMQNFMPELATGQLLIRYSPSGLGYAGDPGGPDIAPMITVELRSYSYDPLLLRLFGITSIGLPFHKFGASLTMEDATGTSSN